MSEDEFGFMTPRMFFNKLKGFAKLREDDYRGEWERTRWIVWQLVNVSGKIVKRSLRLEDIIKFKWEKTERKENDVIKDRKDFERLVEKFGKQWHSS